MSSINLSNLLQSLGADSPALASLLSTSQMQSALQQASPGDLVQLSDQAMQLQQVSLLFGSTDGTQSNAFNPAPDSLFSILGPASSNPSPDPLIQALESSLGLAGAKSRYFQFFDGHSDREFHQQPSGAGIRVALRLSTNG
jgi:hypothetical protein